MLFSTSDKVKWIGFSTFEIFIQLSSLLVCSILVMAKVEGIIDISWWEVFIPIFAGDGLTLYFSTIVFLRMLRTDVTKEAFKRIIWIFILLLLLFLFKFLLCQLLEGVAKTPVSIVMAPLFVIWSLLLGRSCKVAA